MISPRVDNYYRRVKIEGVKESSTGEVRCLVVREIPLSEERSPRSLPTFYLRLGFTPEGWEKITKDKALLLSGNLSCLVRFHGRTRTGKLVNPCIIDEGDLDAPEANPA
jgi:hypothetical protein